MEVSDQVQTTTALLPGQKHCGHGIGGCVGPRALPDGFGEKNISWPYGDSNYGLSNPLLADTAASVTSVFRLKIYSAEIQQCLARMG